MVAISYMQPVSLTPMLYAAAIWIIPLVIAIVCHEVAHGWVANAFGDPTARQLGRLSLNPVRHVDPIGTLVVPLMLALAHLPVFGWAKPVPVVAARMRNPRRDMMLVALAGPVTNLALALLGALLLGAIVRTQAGDPQGGVAGFVFANLVNFILINVFLALFNLLPVPPFDGGHVVQGLLPRGLAAQYARLARYAFPIMLILLVVLPTLIPGANIVARLVTPPAAFLAKFFLGIAGLGV